MKKIIITTGGSGGHVIPSLSIYDALKDDFEVQISTDLRGSKYINNENYNYSLIDVPNLFSNLLFLPYNLIKFCISIIKSYKYLKLNNFNTNFYSCRCEYKNTPNHRNDFALSKLWWVIYS